MNLNSARLNPRVSHSSPPGYASQKVILMQIINSQWEQVRRSSKSVYGYYGIQVEELKFDLKLNWDILKLLNWKSNERIIVLWED